MMERRFDMTDFEQSLKDHADQFVMTPSKRVWNGIYNNLHPGSRWPSITVGVVFLFSLIGVGYLNNSTKLPGHPEPENSSRDINISNKNIDYNLTSDFKSYPHNALSFWKNPAVAGANVSEGNSVESQFVENPVISLADLKAKKESAILNKPSDLRSNGKIVALQNGQSSSSGKVSADQAAENHKEMFSKEATRKGASGNRSKIIAKVSTGDGLTAISNPADDLIKIDNHHGMMAKDLASSKISHSGILNGDAARLDLGFPNPMPIFPARFTIIPVQFSLGDFESAFESDISSQTGDGAADQNKSKTIHKKRNANISWMYFINPTISDVSFNGNALQPINRQNLSSIVVQPGPLGRMLYNARIGYNAGTQMSYAFSLKWQFTTGAELSYSGYNVISNQVHPTFAYLTLKDKSTGEAYSKSYITHYGNGQGQNQISLANYSLQASLPIGLQYSLWENSDVKLSIASSIAPSFVIKSNAFIISADGRNYVNDPALLRPVNLAGNLGTYVTFRSKKLKWIVGPNIRYQMLSSYKKDYPVKEHLIDYGIKIGISR